MKLSDALEIVENSRYGATFNRVIKLLKQYDELLREAYNENQKLRHALYRVTEAKILQQSQQEGKLSKHCIQCDALFFFDKRPGREPELCTDCALKNKRKRGRKKNAADSVRT